MSRPVKPDQARRGYQASRHRRTPAFAAGRCVAVALAGFLFTLPAFGADLESATSEQKRAAQKMFEAADGLFEDGRFDEAAQAFRASYELVASPNSRLMLARSLRELHRYDEAYREYQGTIKDAEASSGKYPDTLKAAQAEADALTVELKKQEPPPVEPKRESAPASKPTVQPAAVTPTPTSAETTAPDKGWRTAAYVAGAVGIAGAATFGVFGLMDRSTYSDLQSKCGPNGCAPGSSDLVDKGRMYQTVANIGLGVAAVGAAAAITLFVAAPTRTEKAVALQVGPGSIALWGDF